jgi:hypothetical protein
VFNGPLPLALSIKSFLALASVSLLVFMFVIQELYRLPTCSLLLFEGKFIFIQILFVLLRSLEGLDFAT